MVGRRGRTLTQQRVSEHRNVLSCLYGVGLSAATAACRSSIARASRSRAALRSKMGPGRLIREVAADDRPTNNRWTPDAAIRSDPNTIYTNHSKKKICQPKLTFH